MNPLEESFVTLAQRKVGDFRRAHVLETPDGLWCLDLNVRASSDEEMALKIAGATGRMAKEDFLPGVLEWGPWERFAKAPMLRNFRVPCKCRIESVGVMVRG